MLFEPKNLRGGETREHSIPNGPDGFFHPAKLLHNLVALGGCRSVAPELGRPDDFPGLIQRNKTVLLAADTDGYVCGGAAVYSGSLAGLRTEPVRDPMMPWIDPAAESWSPKKR